ncbi:MAG: HEPN domain-containing protein [Bacteroidales bacterium]|jgi:uncharacterized protein (UPF0332 family)|nr:HEPN domain-containing protein [Bacteroidales bacterium]
MNQEDRKLLVKMQVDKAHHFLNQAEEMMTQGHSDMAVNRMYYSCYHVVQALFIQQKVIGHSHSGMITQFSKYFVKTGIVPIGEGSFIARLFQLRQKADYNCAYDITKEEALALQEPTRHFVGMITKLIEEEREMNLDQIENNENNNTK